MFQLTSKETYYVYLSATSMHNGLDGLCGIVNFQIKRLPQQGEVFIFINRSRDKLKILFANQSGLGFYYKRFERGRVQIRLEKEGFEELPWKNFLILLACKANEIDK